MALNLPWMFAPRRVEQDSQYLVSPKFGSDGAIGLDLTAAEDVVVVHGAVTMVPTGIIVAIPEGYYGRIAPRSGLAARDGVDVLAGVIDSDYRGEIMVLLTSLKSGTTVELAQGDRVAQLILERAERPELRYCPDMGETGRGDRGFGSTGK